jgi:hypothetical protein
VICAQLAFELAKFFFYRERFADALSHLSAILGRQHTMPSEAKGDWSAYPFLTLDWAEARGYAEACASLTNQAVPPALDSQVWPSLHVSNAWLQMLRMWGQDADKHALHTYAHRRTWRV